MTVRILHGDCRDVRRPVRGHAGAGGSDVVRRVLAVAAGAGGGMTTLASGKHRGVTWTMETGRADCAAPLVTISDCDGLFNQLKVPGADEVRVADLIDAEIARRVAGKRGRRGEVGQGRLGLAWTVVGGRGALPGFCVSP